MDIDLYSISCNCPRALDHDHARQEGHKEMMPNSSIEVLGLYGRTNVDRVQLTYLVPYGG